MTSSTNGRNILRSFGEALSVTGLIAFIILVAGPVEIYVGNPNELEFALQDIVPFLLLAALLTAVVLAAPLCLLPERFLRLAVAVGCGAASMLWVQGNLLPWRYGPLNGKSIEWTAHTRMAVVGGALWLSILIVSVILSKSIYRWRRAIVVTIFAIYAVHVVMLLRTVPEVRPSYVDESEKFTFSSKRNVIILVLDTYQSDVFHEIINERPELRQMFRGFTYYRNAIGGGPLTLPSIPLMLTGKYYDNSVPYETFVSRAFSGESLPGVLRRSGYHVDLFPSMIGYLHFGSEIASNATTVTPYRERAKRGSYLIDLSVFRYAPLALKAYVYADDNWMTQRWLFSKQTDADLRFFGELTKQGRVLGSQPRFKFFHLRGMHAPLSFDQDVVVRHLALDRTNYKSQALGFMKLLHGFFADLQGLGIYENTMIVIVGDHGTSGYQVDVNVGASGYEESFRAGYTVPLNRSIVESGIPLVLIKPFGGGGALKISDAPIMHADLPKTITGSVGIAAFKNLSSIQELRDGAHRKRRFLHYAWSTDESLGLTGYLPPEDEYWVDGFSWLRSSWEPSFRRFTPTGVRDTRPAAFSAPATISFKIGTWARDYLGMGWATHDDKFRWTIGNRAAMIVPLKPSRSALRMSADLTPMLGGAVKVQRVRTIVNGQLVGEWQVANGGLYDAVLPPELTSGSQLKIEFQLPDAVSPRDLGIGPDSRKLGVGLTSVEFVPLPFCDYDRLLQFGAKGDAEVYQGSGWCLPDKDFTWTEGTDASLVLPLRSEGPARLSVFMTPLVGAKRPVQRVIVKVGGRTVDVWHVAAAGEYTAVIPQEFVGGSLLKLHFEMPDAISPNALDGTPDSRLLAVAVSGLKLSQIPKYEYGRVLRFGRGGDGEIYEAKGWALPDPDFTWTEGVRAECVLPVRKPRKDLTLILETTPLVAPPKLSSQRVEIRAGDVLVGTWRISEGGQYRVKIPANVVSSSILKLSFDLPDAATPESLALGHDSRQLALAFYSLKISD